MTHHARRALYKGDLCPVAFSGEDKNTNESVCGPTETHRYQEFSRERNNLSRPQHQATLL